MATYTDMVLNISGFHVPVLSINNWIIIHQKFGMGVTNFNRSWGEYAGGFGDLCGGFWYGNEKVHQLTKTGTWILRVEVQVNYTGKWYSAEYKSFQIGSNSSFYKLNMSIPSYSGDAGESFKAVPSYGISFGMNFTTYDADHDLSPKNCALVTGGGWWHKSCSFSTLTAYGCGVPYWYSLYPLGLSPNYKVKDSRMMIKRL